MHFYYLIRLVILTALFLWPGVFGGSFLAGDRPAGLNTCVELRDGWFYVNGEKFFVNAVGYAGWRPHQWPGTDKVDLKLVDLDFKRIKEAGFNTIRTWAALNEEELSLAKKHDLMVIQGIWIDPTHDFSDPYFVAQTLKEVQEEIKWSSKYDNILMYLVMTEPTQQAVLFAGEVKTLDFFKKLKETIQEIDNKPVSMDSWIPIGFLDHSLWDVITFNAFMFTPESVNSSLGFRGYIEWFKTTHAKEKPFIIGETGGFSVSKKKLGPDFGGNTEEEQSRGNIQSINDAIGAGAVGVCTVAWIDTWHYPSDPDIHDDHPWEWDGLLAIRDDSDSEGTPRKVYYDLKKYNQALIIEPKDSNSYSGKVPLQIFSNEYVGEVLYRIDNDQWKRLKKEGLHWWNGDWDSTKVKDGKRTLEIKALDRSGRLLVDKRINFWIFNKKVQFLPYCEVSIIPLKKEYGCDEKVEAIIRITERIGTPVARKRVEYGFFLPTEWKESFASGITDNRGELEISCNLQFDGHPAYIILSVGVAQKINDYPMKFGDLVFVRLKGRAETRLSEETPPLHEVSFKPFAVYIDKGYPGNHYAPSGWMGDYKDLTLDDSYSFNPRSGKTCIRITYSAKGSLGGGWAGIYWQNPLNNWGDVEGGFNLTDAKRLTFWARGDRGGERIEQFRVGGMGGNYPDSDMAITGPIILNRKWEKYSIDLTDKDLSYISGGFCVFVQKEFNPEGCVFYLDDIIYE